MDDDIFSPDTEITISTHVSGHIVFIDGEAHWCIHTRQPDGTYEQSFELIELES